MPLISNLGKNGLKQLRAEINKELSRRYGKTRQVFYGINRTPSDEWVERFFSATDTIRYRLVFGFMAYCGCRPGEVAPLKWEQVRDGRLMVSVLKKGRLFWHSRKMPVRLLQWFELYSNRYRKKYAPSGFIFPAKYITRSNHPHISVKQIYDVFRRVVLMAQLDGTYGSADDRNNPLCQKRGRRELHNFSPKSFRHYYKKKLARATPDPFKVRQAMAHDRMETTAGYGQYDEQEMDELIERAF